MEGSKVLIFEGLYAALIGVIKTDESKVTRIIAMNEKRFSLDAQIPPNITVMHFL